MDQDKYSLRDEIDSSVQDFESKRSSFQEPVHKNQKERKDFIKHRKEGNLTFKLRSRVAWSVFFSGLLIVQYVFLYRVIWVSLFLENRPPEFIISALTVGTLSQTYLVIREIIQWIFTDIDGIDTDWKEDLTRQKSHQKE